MPPFLQASVSKRCSFELLGMDKERILHHFALFDAIQIVSGRLMYTR